MFFNKQELLWLYYMKFYCHITVVHEQLRVPGFADAAMTALPLTTLNTYMF